MDKIFLPYLERIECSLHSFLPNCTNSEWQKLSFSKLSSCVTNEHLENLINPCRTLMDLGGKRWRPLLMVLCAELAQESGCCSEITEKDIYDLTALVEFVHTASLIHDDIEDSADTRRGKPAAHISFGLDTALNAASWLYFEASTCIQNLNVTAEFKNILYNLYFQELRRLHLGQAMDIYWHRNPSLIPSIEEYSQMVRCKTGTLASLAVQSGILSGGGSFDIAEKAGSIAAFLGEGFQILDDVQNLTTGNPGKKRGDDIVEGKKSLPVLIHINENPCDKEKISKYFEQAALEGVDSPAVENCIGILNSKGAIEKASEIGKDYINKNVNLLSDIFGKQESCLASDRIKKLFTDMLSNGK